jgi:hypothetical protein
MRAAVDLDWEYNCIPYRHSSASTTPPNAITIRGSASTAMTSFSVRFRKMLELTEIKPLC